VLEWIEAGALQIGDAVVSAYGDFGTVDAVVSTDGTAEVYNLTVDEAHTYFVGDGAWLVHNSCPMPYTQKDMERYNQLVEPNSSPKEEWEAHGIIVAENRGLVRGATRDHPHINTRSNGIDFYALDNNGNYMGIEIKTPVIAHDIQTPITVADGLFHKIRTLDDNLVLIDLQRLSPEQTGMFLTRWDALVRENPPLIQRIEFLHK